jgi:uncharacterized protein (TIGR02001 family)
MPERPPITPAFPVSLPLHAAVPASFPSNSERRRPAGARGLPRTAAGGRPRGPLRPCPVLAEEALMSICTRSTSRAVFPAALAAALAATVSMPARAADVSGSVTVVNDYLFRGLSQTNQKPALQAGVEVAGKNGLYAGAWGSNISWLSDASSDAAPISSSLEMDGYAGWRGDLGGGFSLDVGVYTYYYPGTYPAGFTSPNTTEAYVGGGYGDFSLKYSHAFTNLFGFADSKHSDYWDLSFGHDFGNDWSVSAHVGHQTIKHVPGANYTDWNVGVSRSFGKGWSVSLGYYDTNADAALYTNAYGHNLARATGVLSLGKSF